MGVWYEVGGDSVGWVYGVRWEGTVWDGCMV